MESGSSPTRIRVQRLTIEESVAMDGVGGFNDTFPDEILMQIIKWIRIPAHMRNVVEVCKRWYILATCTRLQRRVPSLFGGLKCLGLTKPVAECAKQKVVKWDKVEAEWRVAQLFIKSCKCHVRSVEIKDCTQMSSRGYSIISYFGGHLKMLRLESCSSIRDADLAEILDGCPNLRTLHLSQVVKLTMRNVEKKALRLREFRIHGCGLVTGGTVLDILKHFPSLESLSLTGMRVSPIPFQWEDDDFGRGSPLKLRTLDIRNSRVITDKALQLLSRRLSNVRDLNLCNLPEISDDGLKPLIAACGGNLQRLVLTQCPQITDASVSELCAVATNALRDISLSGTRVTDDCVRLLEKSDALELRQLCLARCPEVTDDLSKRVDSLQRRRRKGLKTLDVQSCPRLSASGLESLQTAMGATNGKLVRSAVKGS